MNFSIYLMPLVEGKVSDSYLMPQSKERQRILFTNLLIQNFWKVSQKAHQMYDYFG